MGKKAEVITFENVSPDGEGKREMRLASGRRVTVHTMGEQELLEIEEAAGEVVLKVRLTESGPVISVDGARLELKAVESIDLSARKVKISAEEEVVVESRGGLKINASQKMKIHSNDNIGIVGKKIFLN